MSSVTVCGLTKEFGAARILDAIDLEVRDGEFLVVVGPSGCGKSTFLRLVAGLDTPTSGSIRIGAREVTHLAPAARGIAMVFQSYALYPHMTAYQNMAFGLRLERRARDEVDRRIRRAADLLQIGELLDRKPATLSGGQRQRVAIGRAIVRSPEVFLFDEPLSNLDASLRGDMRLEIARLHRELRATTIYVTHDQLEAMTLGTRIVVLNRGRIEQEGTPLAIYREPRNTFVAGFIGSPRMNLVPARVVGAAPDGAGLEIDVGGARLAVRPQRTGPTPGAQVTVGVRPEQLTLEIDAAARSAEPSAGSVWLTGEVVAVEHLGNVSMVHLRTTTALLAVAATAGTEAAVGRRMAVLLRADRLHLFDERGERW